MSVQRIEAAVKRVIDFVTLALIAQGKLLGGVPGVSWTR